ncbi:MAG: zinc-ribbon domain-containing protein [Burkholderiaceae bacterium]|nr:zinc-ribbon domain-containing protein [Burkholderiaceae bacterium]
MSLVTRCPACSTQFKVVPDQIRVAAGWVRCGKCGEVFDASSYMLPHAQQGAVASAPPASAPPPAPEAPTGDAAQASTSVVATDPAAAEADSEHDDSHFVNALHHRAKLRAARMELPREATLTQQEEETESEIETGSDSEMEAEIWPAVDSESRSFFVQPQPQPRESSFSFSFLSSLSTLILRPIRSEQWLVLLPLLLFGLVLQMTISQRDWLAARMPGLTPVLLALCAPLGCSVQPYRQLEAIIIDSSALKRVDGGRFRFSITLRNSANWPVASPALELALIDAQEQTLARKVLSAAELAAPPALPGRGEFGDTYALTLSEAANPDAIAGYRVTAFYP